MSSVQSASRIATRWTVTPRLFERLPGREVGVVIEQREHDFVACTQLPADRAAHGERKRGHVEAEDDLVRIASEKVGHSRARFGDGFVGATAGKVGSASVGIRVLQIIGNRVDDTLRNLGTAGAVEIGCGMPIYGFRKRRELGADPGEVECGRNVVLSGWHNVFYSTRRLFVGKNGSGIC